MPGIMATVMLKKSAPVNGCGTISRVIKSTKWMLQFQTASLLAWLLLLQKLRSTATQVFVICNRLVGNGTIIPDIAYTKVTKQ
ncbi:hypothetical protein D3C73_1288970 [compost metagenome]